MRAARRALSARLSLSGTRPYRPVLEAGYFDVHRSGTPTVADFTRERWDTQAVIFFL